MGENKVIGIIAVIIIVGALAFIGMKFFGGKSEPTSLDEEAKTGAVLICTKCGHQFQSEDIPKSAAGGMSAMYFKCEKCGEMAAVPAMQCVHCKKYFLPKGQTNPKCPYCGKLQSQGKAQKAGAPK